jgi:hypothetical protein
MEAIHAAGESKDRAAEAPDSLSALRADTVAE